MELVPLGDSTLILRVDDSLGEVLAAVRKLEAAHLPGVVEVAPAFASVAIFLQSPEHFENCAAAIPAALGGRRRAAKTARAPRSIEVPVCYDPEFALDLEDVARHCELSPDEVVTRHTAGRYHVRCVGFTPGFPYLSGLPAVLTTPRRTTPRTAVPAGSVAIAGGQAGIYPLRSPGGWNIIGRTHSTAFRRLPEARGVVRTRRSIAFCGNHAGGICAMGEVTVLRAGPLTTVQDLGRVEGRREGVSVGGALDLFAARVANLLVGNPEDAALLEITLGGSRLRFDDDRRVAWCGGAFPARIAQEKFPAGRPGFVRQGEELEFDSTKRGGRAWIAIAGGIDVPLVLGSRSTDLRSAFGGYEGRALRDGDQMSLGDVHPREGRWAAARSLERAGRMDANLHACPGPARSPRIGVGRICARGADWFAEATLHRQ